MFRRATLLVLLLLAAGLPAVATATEHDLSEPQRVLLTLDAPDAVTGDDLRTWSGAMDAATIARVTQSVAAAVEAAGGTASIPSYRSPHVLATLPYGVDATSIAGVKTATELPTMQLALDNALDQIQIGTNRPSLSIGTDPDVNEQALTGHGQIIAILDAGVDASHPFFQDADGNSRVIAEACFSRAGDCPTESGTAISSSGPGTSHPLPPGVTASGPDHDHGNHVAGIFAGRNPETSASEPLRGVAPDVSIISIRVFPVTAIDGNVADLVDGMAWLRNWIDANATVPNSSVSVMNLSLGFKSDQNACPVVEPMVTVIDELLDRGTLTVAATGNDAFTNAISAPSCYTNTIAVTASEKANVNGDIVDRIAPYANVSNAVDLAAPGTSIMSSGLNATYLSHDGTSMAAPMVSGAIALARQATPELASGSTLLDQMRTALKATSVTVDDDITKNIPLLRMSDVMPALPEDDVLDAVPGAPQSVNATGNATKATVTFAAPTLWPRSVVGYTVTAIDTADETTVDTCVRGLRQSRSCEFAGLTTGSTYRFDVTATNLFGVSVAAQSDPVTLTEPPPPPPPPPAPAPAPEPAPAPVFSDISGSVHAANVAVLVERGVLRGCGVDRFCPRNTVTRGQFATMLANVLELPARPPGSSGFVDVDGNTHAAGIRAVVAAGLFGGVSDTRFDPNAPMRRGQIASVLAGAAGLSARPAAAGQFTDVAGSVHAGAIGAVVEAGLARGTSTTTFAPSARLPREQAATLVVNLIEFREN